MIMRNFLMFAIALSSLSAARADAQGTFENLDFEQANVPFVPPGQLGAAVSVSNALPHWTAYFISGQLSQELSTIYQDNASGGGPAVSIHDASSLIFQPLQGSYSVFLQGASAGPAAGSAIGQTGQIPLTAASLMFWASPLSSMQLSFGGQNISLVKLSSTPSYDILGGDISMFAGQTAELRFIGPRNGGGYFDNISFSIQPIPEPSTFCLFGFGALLIRICFSRAHLFSTLRG